jgi:Leucine carboxyl methyltransferase
MSHCLGRARGQKRGRCAGSRHSDKWGFLHAQLAGALGALGHRIMAHAQSPTASCLAEGRPSDTAQVTANLRAAHQLIDQPRIFYNPLALRIIGAQAEAGVRARAGKSLMVWLRPFVAVRSRYAEDELAQAVQRGVHQYVVLAQLCH